MSDPVVTIITSLPPASATTPIVFTVVGGAGAPLRRMWASVAFPGIIGDEVVHNGSRFGAFYTNGTNTRTSTPDGLGYQVTILRDGGWPVGAFPVAASFAINAVDTLGNGQAVGQPQTRFFALWTDSNGMGAGTSTADDDPADNTGTPNSNVVLDKIYTTNFIEPVTPFNMGTGDLRLETSTSPAHGPELAIGKALDEIFNGPNATPDTDHKVWLIQFSIHSSELADWQHGSTAGTLSPLLGGGNLDDDSSNQALTAALAAGRIMSCAFPMLGTNDASDNSATTAIPTNVPAFITRKRLLHGSQLLFVWTILQPTIPAGTFPFAATARANLIAALSAIPGVALVYADDLPTIDDLAHFTSIAEQVLGTRKAYSYIRLAGIRERVVTAPTVVGVSQATYNGATHGTSGITGVTGANLRVFPWQGSSGAGRDLMFHVQFTGAIGAGSSIPTPSGWSAAGFTQVSNVDSGGVGNQLAVFTKQCLQADLDAGTPANGGPGFPQSFVITPGGAQFAQKLWTVRGPAGFPALQGSAVSFSHGTHDNAAITAGGVTLTVAGTVFILVAGWSATGQSYTVTSGSLTGITQVFGGAYPSGSGNFLYLGLWQVPAGIGATGNFTVTPLINASTYGFVWAM